MLKHYIELPPTVHILCLGTFVNRAGTFILPFLALYLTEKLGFRSEIATAAMGLYGFGAIGAALVGGHLADLIGRRAVMAISLLGGAGVLIIFSTLTSTWAVLIAVACFPFLAEMYRPAVSAMLADLVAPEKRGHAYGLMYVSINLGFSVGPVVGGYLATVSYRWLFWGDALTAALYAMIILFAIRETLPRLQRKTETPPAGPQSDDAPRDSNARAAGDEGLIDGDSADRPQPGVGTPPAGLAKAAAAIARDRTFLIFCLATLCVGLVYMQSMSTFPLHLRKLNFGPEQYGKLIAINGMLIVVLQLPLTALMRRFDRAKIIALASAIVGIGFGLNLVATTLTGLAITIVIWTLGEMMHAPYMAAVVTDLAPIDLRARYLGVFTMMHSSATMIGAPLGGAIFAEWGPAVLWSGALVMGLVSAALYLLVYSGISARPPEEVKI